MQTNALALAAAIRAALMRGRFAVLDGTDVAGWSRRSGEAQKEGHII